MGKPNILLLVLDAARADRFSCYGYHRKTTPNIDRLAQEGTIFLNHYAAANETFPSHVSIFTGIHPYFHGAAVNRSQYDGRYPTIQETLSELGYQTIGLSYNPHIAPLRGITRGFKIYHEIWKREHPEEAHKIWEMEKLENDNAKESPFWPSLSQGKHCLRHSYPSKDKRKRGYLRTLIRQARKDLIKHLDNIQRFARVPNFLDALSHPLRKRRKCRKYKRRLEKYDKDKGGKIIINIIKEEIKRCKSENSNFYIFANLLEPHWPYLPPKGFRNLFHQDEITSYNALCYLITKRKLSFTTKLSPEDWVIINALYDAGLVYTDALLGDLFSFMESEGIMNETLIAITSDHGELLGEHGLVKHGTGLYEPLIKTPLVVRYPERFKCGHRENRLAQSIDFFPTILDLVDAGEKRSSFNHKGISLCPDKLKELEDRFIIIDDIKRDGAHTRPELQKDANVIERAIITQKYKYVWSNSGRHRLHNIKEDPLEEKNLYSEDHRPIIETLHTKMANWYQEQLSSQQDFDLYRYDYTRAELDTLPPGAQRDEVKRLEKMLKELGYME
ncbi:MAG: sulfatase-like hydrolase/transferase [Candidatus Brocadiales bacterium]